MVLFRMDWRFRGAVWADVLSGKPSAVGKWYDTTSGLKCGTCIGKSWVVIFLNLQHCTILKFFYYSYHICEAQPSVQVFQWKWKTFPHECSPNDFPFLSQFHELFICLQTISVKRIQTILTAVEYIEVVVELSAGKFGSKPKWMIIASIEILKYVELTKNFTSIHELIKKFSSVPFLSANSTVEPPYNEERYNEFLLKFR